jgi:hypothetical protein
LRTILFQNNSAAITQFVWTVERDLTLVSVNATSGNGVVTTDPSLTFALFGTPTELISTGKDIFVISLYSGIPFHLAFPFKEGTKVYLNLGATKMSIVLTVEDNA